MAESWTIKSESGGSGSEVKYVSESKETIKVMRGLALSALAEAAKTIRKELKKATPSRAGNLRKTIASWKFIGKQDGIPQLQIGFRGAEGARKYHKKPAFGAHWLEFGSGAHQIHAREGGVLGGNGYYFGTEASHPGTKGTHLLRDTVYNNIEKIRAAEEKYLSELTKTLEAAKQKADESEEVEE